MTITEIIKLVGNNPKPIIAYYAILLAITIIASIYVKRENYKSPFIYLFSVLVYSVSIPGIVSIILVIYGFFFQRINFLNVNLIAYFLPVIMLVVVLAILQKAVRLKSIPGFKRISGLFMMITLALFVSYVLQRMFFGVIFFGQFQTLLIIFAVILIAIKIGWDRMVN